VFLKDIEKNINILNEVYGNKNTVINQFSTSMPEKTLYDQIMISKYNASLQMSYIKDFLIKYPQSKLSRKVYETSNALIISKVLSGNNSIDDYKKVFEYYDQKYLLDILKPIWQKKDYVNGDDFFKILIKKYPNDVKINYLLASYLEDKGNFKDAYFWYKKIAEAFSNSDYYARGLLKTAWMAMLDEKYKEAIEIYNRYIIEAQNERDWEVAVGFYYKAYCYKKLGDQKQANQVLGDMINKYPFSFYSLISREELNLKLTEELQTYKYKDICYDAVSAKQYNTLRKSVILMNLGLEDQAISELTKLDVSDLTYKYSEIVASIYNASSSPQLGVTMSYKIFMQAKQYISKSHLEYHYPLLFISSIEYY
jgi:tetratricopeptide (TPR) repeat protein